MMLRYTLLGTAFIATALLAGCPDRTISEVDPAQGRVEYKDIPVTVNRKIDILFMVDDSNSMADKQVNLKANFPNFINVLDTIPGGRPDLHIGVITSDLGGRGAAEQTASGNAGPCNSAGGKNGLLQIGMAGAAVSGTFISDSPGAMANSPRVKNYTGDLATVFAQMATQGDRGCGFEQQLEAVKRALTPGVNANFLRPDAYLAVVFLTDEDDCSFLKGSDILNAATGTYGALQSFRCTRFGVTCDQGGADASAMNQLGPKGACHPNDASPLLTKVSDYVTFLKGLKPDDPNKVIVAGVMGTTEPFQVQMRAPSPGMSELPALAHSCTYQGAGVAQVADPPTRLKFFLDQFPNRSTFTTICQQDLSGGLQQIAQLLKTVLGDPCITGKLKGPPYECSVSDVTNQGKSNQTEMIVPACNATNTNTPCWRIETDAANCTGSDHFVLKVDRGNTTPAPDTHEIAYCVTES